MNNFYLLIIMSLVSSIIIIINSIIIKDISIMTFTFMNWITGTIAAMCMYFYFMSNKDKKDIFTLKYKKLWLLSLFLSLVSITSYYYYYKVINNLGPSKTQTIYQSLKLLTLLLISTLILQNTKINIRLINGIFFVLLGMYILKDSNEYV